jgi:hypothetical protein
MKMKRLRILVEGNPKPYRLQIHPSTKTSDVLAHLKLDEDYDLYLASDPKRHFTSEEVLYDHVNNDEKLIARLHVKIDVEEAWREVMKLVEIADEPSLAADMKGR